MKSKRFRDIDGRPFPLAHEAGDERKPPTMLPAILVVALILAGSLALLVSGLRAVLLTDSAEAVIVGEVTTSCDLEDCYHNADVEFVTASGQSVVTEAAVDKDAQPGDLTGQRGVAPGGGDERLRPKVVDLIRADFFQRPASTVTPDPPT